MATTAKGIRVSQLAKELSITSKAILDRIRKEGIPNPPVNAQSTLSLGLAETVREWYPSAQAAVAPEPQTPVETVETHDEESHKTKSHPKKKNPEDSPDIIADAAPSPVGEPMPGPIEEPSAPTVVPEASAPVEALKSEPAPVEPVAAPIAPVILPPAPPVKPVPAVTPTAVVPTAVAPIAVTPAAVAPTAPPAAHPHPHKPHHKTHEPRAPRPTVVIDEKTHQPHNKKTGAPAAAPAKMHVPSPAKIQGPRVVREEKPDIVSTPRKRTQQVDSAPPAYVQAKALAGRGVKVSEEDEEAENKKKAAKSRTLSSRRRGLDGRRGEAEAKIREFSEADLEERRIRLGDPRKYAQGLDTHLKKSSADRLLHAQAKTAAERGGAVIIEEPVTVRSLAETLGVKSSVIITKLVKQGIMATVNQALPAETAMVIAMEYNVDLKVVAKMSLDEQLASDHENREFNPEDLKPRPPIVTILGHVDHGKTSLLDKIRSANVAAGEAGGITQHIAAWMVSVGEGENKKTVTFIDTPGHQAFTSMRARGANMTDVVVLVVSAAEGVQPQTVESINHARAAEVPIIVALNKIDRADANIDMVLGQLAAQGLNPVEWGGDTEVVRCSAQTGAGIDDLIEILDLQTQILELKTDATQSASGSVIEAQMDAGLGPIATVLVQDGTLKVGDVILAGRGYGRVRAILNDRAEQVPAATASMPVIVSGLSSLPGAGDRFHVVDDIDHARSVAEERQSASRLTLLASQNRVTTAANLLDVMTAEQGKTINLIIKTDVQGSAETLVSSVTNMNTQEVKVRVIHSGVGAISESDVELAIATKAKPTDNRVGIVGFNVVPEDAARILAERHHVDIKTYRIIYEIFDDLKKALSGMLEPEIREKLHGHADIRAVYKFSKVGNIAGCFVTDGHIQRGSKIRLIRDGKIIGEDMTLESLRRVKDDVREVKSGFECGLKLAGFDDIKQGDRVEAYSRETIERTL